MNKSKTAVKSLVSEEKSKTNVYVAFIAIAMALMVAGQFAFSFDLLESAPTSYQE